MSVILTYAFITCLSLTAVDGDTIKCDGQNMRIMGPGSPNRSGIDAPEIRKAGCQAERTLGIQAKRRLDQLLKHDVRIQDSKKRDRYGRPLVWVRMSNGQTAGEVLLKEGYAQVWRPGRNIDWCR